MIKSRRPFLTLAALLIAAGLLLRLVPWGLPLAVHHYGGGVLWGAMVFALVAAARPRTWGRAETIFAAVVLAALVELVRRVHAPWLDAFRATLAGQLLLGRIFSAWNFLAYGIGIAGAAGATWRLRWMSATTSARPFVVQALILVLASGLALPSARAQDTPNHGNGKVEVLWLGQSAMRITTPSGKVIMIDPFITQDPKTPPEWKDLKKLGHLDLILVTHGHPDHVGDTFELSRINDAKVYAPAGLQDTFTTLGLLPADHAPKMNKGGVVTPLGPDIAITMVHADHSSEFLHTNPFTGKPFSYPGGEPVGFVIRLENGFTIYHMGDTAVFGDMRMIGELFHPDLVMVPIGGHYTMDPQGAAYALRAYLRPHYAIPMHYGTTPQLTGTPEELIRAMGPNLSTKIVVMKPGETKTF